MGCANRIVIGRETVSLIGHLEVSDMESTFVPYTAHYLMLRSCQP